MRKLTLVSAILFILFVLSNIVQAGNNLTVSYSPTNITRSMDFAVRSNSLNYLAVQETTATNNIYKKAKESKPPKLKSPTTALVIALVPGSVVHGAGYFYAGKPKTGLFLFGIEVIGAGLVYAGALSGFAEWSQDGTGKERPELAWMGIALFAGSLLADVIGAPEAARKHKEGIIKK